MRVGRFAHPTHRCRQPSRFASPAPDQGEEDGWKSWVEWQNATQATITSFVATWNVPFEPTPANGQLIYLFNGLQDDGHHHILQPVLQWGTSPATGSGYAWGLASFWVGEPADPMFCSEWVPVAVGTSVTGRITVARQKNDLFSCTCEFDGYAGTRLTAQNLPALVDGVLTLEAYGTGPDAPYPKVAGTDFTDIAIATGDTMPTVNWSSAGAALIRPNGDVEVLYPVSSSAPAQGTRGPDRQ